MENLEKCFISANPKGLEEIKRNLELNNNCLSQTRAYAKRFIADFDFLTKYGFTMTMGIHEHSMCNNGFEEYAVCLSHIERGYHAMIYFPIEKMLLRECDLISFDLIPNKTVSGKESEYTNQEAAMTLATIFG